MDYIYSNKQLIYILSGPLGTLSHLKYILLLRSLLAFHKVILFYSHSAFLFGKWPAYLFIDWVPCFSFGDRPVFIMHVYSLRYKKFSIRIWHVNLSVIFLFICPLTIIMLVKVIRRKRQFLWVLMWKAICEICTIVWSFSAYNWCYKSWVMWLIFWMLQ